MKIRLLIIILIGILHNPGFGQFWLQQHFDGADTSANNSILIDIDTSSTNVWQIGKPQKNIFHKASTVPNALITDTINYYPPNNQSKVTFKYNVQYGWGSLALQWMQKIDLDLHHDAGIVEYSKDSGNTWQNVVNNPNVLNYYGFQPANLDTGYNGKRGFGGTDTTWRNVWLCFYPGYFNQTPQDVYFRFTLLTDSVDSHFEGWMIDNMMLNLTMVHPVNEMKRGEYLKVYPTLTSRFVRIEHPSGNDQVPLQHIELWTVDGKLLEKTMNDRGMFGLDLDRYEGGMYILRIITPGRVESHPVMLYKN